MPVPSETIAISLRVDFNYENTNCVRQHDWFPSGATNGNTAQAMNVKCNTEGRSVQATGITYSECVSVTIGIQHAMRMRHIAICGLPVPTIFFHTISQTHDFRKKKLLNIKRVFWFIPQFSSAALLFLRTERDMIKNIYWSSCNVPVKLVRC